MVNSMMGDTTIPGDLLPVLGSFANLEEQRGPQENVAQSYRN
jgi:hypothetical protein